MAALDQIRTSAPGQIESLFIAKRKKVWTGPSFDKNTGPGPNFGVQEPFVWTALTDSNTSKHLKSFDTRAFPLGSTIRDVQRVTKFMGNPRGVIWGITQMSMQKENAFNETRVWNPLSPITAAARKGLLGLMDRPTRHIEGAGGSILGNIASGFMSSVGLQSEAMKSSVPGTATAEDVLSLAARAGKGYATKGLTRGGTARMGRNHFSEQWGETHGNSGGGFLSKLTSGLINKLKSLIPTTNQENADWKYRVEYSDKVDVFKIMLEDKAGKLGYSVKNIRNRKGETFSVSDVHYFTGNKEDGTRESYVTTVGVPNSINGYGTAEQNFALLKDQQFSPNQRFGVDVVNKRDRREFSTETTGKYVSDTQISKLEVAINNWNGNGYTVEPTFYTGGQTTYSEKMKVANDPKLQYGSKKNADSIEKKKKFGGSKSHDSYNAIDQESSGSIDEGGFNKMVVDSTTNGSVDQIFFYFYDVINSRYIPFRATVTGINENVAPKWEEINYMGRADMLYAYNGFTRTLNFGFTVYANSIKELMPMWNRINYLSGLTRPSKYTASTGGAASDFMYPPIIKFRIGDLFVDQPGVITSFGLTVPDDSPWETVRSDGTYSYAASTHQAIQVKGNARQLPMKVDISITLNLMEKELSRTGNKLYFTGDPASVLHSITQQPSTTTQLNLSPFG